MNGKRFAKLLVISLLALSLAGCGSNKDFAIKGSRIMEVKPGMTTTDIANLLHEKQLVKNPTAFRYEARFKGLADKLQAGVYQIEGGLSNSEIVEVLAKGRVKELHFTLPEGYTIKRTAQKLEAEGICKAEKFIALAKDYAPYPYMQTDNPEVKFKAEGFIYPSTYNLPLKVSEEEILKRFVDQFDETLTSSGAKKTMEERKLNIRDVVNLAAMVEMEAIFNDEQPRIAGVFLKRLEIGMPIQSDTTIQYILGEQKEIVTYADLKIPSPYNTYINAGLPPGPVACPGLSAIKAVLQPEQTDYLYFVAQKDGHHRFTKTYAEHLKAIDDIEKGK